jgi:succinyl-CoA synthetase beta subunit
MVAEAVDIAKETYFAILMDRVSGGPIILASPMGGMDIEAVARDHPEKILIVSYLIVSWLLDAIY